MKGAPLVVGFIVLIAVGIGAVTLIAPLIRGERAVPLGRLELPAPGEIRPDYLADGTPVWVARHDDGAVDVLSGFDTHRPSNVGKILWWCAQSEALENPEHGSTYDEYGFRIGGPAPTGLPAYATTVEGSHVVVGEPQAAPPPDAPHTGPEEVDRGRCLGPDHERIWHTFEDWHAWNSPTAAVQAAPEGWILLEAQLALRDGSIAVCALDGCADSVVAANVDPTNAEREFGPLFGDRFIAQVQDGALIGVTRVMPSDAGEPGEAEPPAEP
jgi:hypothetical protein